MPKSLNYLSRILRDLVRWVPIASLAGVLAGTASALLLVSLDLATRVREAHTWLILLLAPAGYCVGLLYKHLGEKVAAGNNLILEEVHAPKSRIQFRMTPLILLGTFLTHLFGGSAGREGTAIQTGASLADQFARPFRLDPVGRRVLLLCGISGGFASVFGTPLAGAIFGLEVLIIGAITYEAIIPCFVTAFVADFTCRAWHIHHTVYIVSGVDAVTPTKVLSACAAGLCFGLMAMIFTRSMHAISALAQKYIKRPELRPVAGGLLVTAAVFALHTTKYIGLGIPTIQAAFTTNLPWYDFAVKSLFTSVTLGAGFKGGEVTPLFFIGATLGNALSRILPLSPSLLAGMGFAAVFAGAANTPIASTFMAIELFGGACAPFAGIACVVSYLFSGHSGIYDAQRLGRSKHSVPRESAETLSEL